MKNTRMMLFLIFILIYIVGISAGSISQVKAGNQAEMSEYLKTSVSGYTTSAANGIKSVLSDNMKLFLPIAAAGLFKWGILIIGAVILLKGYCTGFAITAVLRVYGLGGMILCGANIISALCIIPSVALYGSATARGGVRETYERTDIFKRYFLFLFIIAAVFAADCMLRGFLSTVFMKYAPKLT